MFGRKDVDTKSVIEDSHYLTTIKSYMKAFTLLLYLS